MKKTFKSIIAIAMSLCMLGTVTACGDSDKGSGKSVSAGKNDKKKQTESSDAAKYVYRAANTVLVEADEENRMTDILKADKPVIICSDKSKNINADGVDDKFYDDMHMYYADIDTVQWLAVVKMGECESTYVKVDDNKFIGHYYFQVLPKDNDVVFRFDPDAESKAVNDTIDDMTFDEVYDKIVAENQ